jgi:hypothetical protein
MTVMGAPLWTLRAHVTAGYGLVALELAMADDDTNEETARPPPNDATSDLSSVLNGAETLNLAWGHYHSLRRPIFIKWETAFCKPIKHLFTFRTTR